MKFDRSRKMIEDASQVLPGGVNSNFRIGMKPTPLVFERGEGPYLFDVDGNRLIDYYLGMGPMILGHNPSAVIEAVRAQLDNGILFAGQSEIEREAAELVCEMVPSAEKVRFSCAGSEVVQAAWRLARAHTGRSIILKFEGHYHGWLDSVLWSVAPPVDAYGPLESPTPVPASAGQDLVAGQHTEVLPWNDLELVKQRLERGDVAGVIMEPVMCNTSTIFPADGYLEGVREACTATDTILIFDEVITGFRVSPGGAQELYGVTPDLTTMGKAIANGFPLSCLAGRSDLLDLFVMGGVMHGGTYNAQPATMAALIATLSELRKAETFEAIETQGSRLRDGISAALGDAGIQARVEGFPGIFHVGMGIVDPVTDYRTSLQADRERYIRFTEALHYQGVRALERGAWFVSSTHTSDVVDQTIEAVTAVAREI